MRILIPNRITIARYEKVKEQMRSMGAPVIDCIEIEPGYYFALEGSHRTTAAHELGLYPTIVVVDVLVGHDPVLDRIRKEIPVRVSRGLAIEFCELLVAEY